MFFLTVVTNFRRPFLTSELARRVLRSALLKTQAEHPFTIEAIVLMPDHFHTIWQLPEGDSGYSLRDRLVKARFTHEFLAAGALEGGRSKSRMKKRERSVWQRRFYEHVVRDERDFERICNYIHFNPVKHGHAACPHAWPYSSFARLVNAHKYEPNWLCTCHGRPQPPVDFDDIADVAGE